MIRIDLENVIKNSKLYGLAKKNALANIGNLVQELADEIELEYFEQDGVEPTTQDDFEDSEADYNEREPDNNREEAFYNE